MKNYTTVERCRDGDIWIVGEQHESPGAPRSARLAERLLDEVEPPTVAIEMRSPRANNRGAMGATQSFADRKGVPLIAIDTSWRSFLSHSSGLSGLHQVANNFSFPIEENGDLDMMAVHDARRAVLEQYGEEVYDAMYLNRERDMCHRLNWLVENYDTPIVAAVGAFHVRALANRLANDFSMVPIEEGRVRDYEG